MRLLASRGTATDHTEPMPRHPRRPRRPPRHRALFALAIGVFVTASLSLAAGRVAAHNTLVSSDPADGAVVDVAPTQVTWEFDNAVPLETMTVTLIDASGVRSELDGSTHGAAGEQQVVTPLPDLQPGDVSVRWRLVSPDGHPITGRISFTITAAAPSSTAPSSTAPSNTAPPGPPATAAPGSVPPTDATTGATTGGTIDDDDDASSTPSAVRWFLRYASYAAIMAAAGILLCGATTWSVAATHPLLRRVLSRSLLATAILAVPQLLIVASDVSGEAPWSSLGSVDAATVTDAGMALALRIVLALALWTLLFRSRIAHPDIFWTAVSIAGLGLLATWAFAGHARSMRWPVVGVVTDVAHHAAAAAWLAGLAIVVWVVIPRLAPADVVAVVRRFSSVATVCVGVLVVTGVVQSVRLVDSPGALLDARHGRYLTAKVVALAAMLVLAHLNRRRVRALVADEGSSPRLLGPLRTAVVAEFAIGVVIVGITAAMVVAPPAVADAAADAARHPAHVHDMMSPST